MLAGTYKHIFKDQLRLPIAYNNHIVNCIAKLQYYLVVKPQCTCSPWAVEFLGPWHCGKLQRPSHTELSRGYKANMGSFDNLLLRTIRWLNNSKRLNMNRLINPRDFDGELMANLTLKFSSVGQPGQVQAVSDGQV